MELTHHVLEWALSERLLGNRMCFVAGPRQVGKTTAIQKFLAQQGTAPLYFNWDTPTVKKRYAANSSFFVEDLPPEIPHPWIAIDEIHKYPKWKNILKGYYDEWKSRVRIIVTGSARLDLFRKSGDSLVGRYFLYRMLPLGPGEILSNSKIHDPTNDWHPQQGLKIWSMASPELFEATQHLLHLSGFPEPCVNGSADFCNRWREEHISLITHEDLRDLTRILHLKKLETLLYLLPSRVGAPLSLNVLTHPLECSYGSVKQWLEALKKVYLTFNVSPWSAQLARSILKEEKLYFWDWGMVENEGFRFENFIAVMLEKAVSAWNEWGKGPYQLHYLRTKEKAEVDFAIADRKKVHMIVECKLSDEALSPSLPYFQKKLGGPLSLQVVNKSGVCTQKGRDLYVVGIDRLLALLP